MPTITKYPNTCVADRVETNSYGDYTETSFYGLNNLKANNNVDAYSSSIASKTGTQSKPCRVRVSNFGFVFDNNAKINKITAEWEEYIRTNAGSTVAVPTIPYKNVLFNGANGGSNTAYKKNNSSVPTSRTNRSIAYTLSEIPNMRPAHIMASGFGVYLNPARNTSYNSGVMYLDYIRVAVDYTNPTYAFTSTISTGKVIGEEIVCSITLSNTNNCHNGFVIPVTLDIPAGLTLLGYTSAGTYNTSTRKWNASLNSNRTATITLRFRADSVGTKTFKATVDSYGTNISKSTTVLAASYELSGVNPGFVTQGQDITQEITITTNSNAISTVNANIPIPQGFVYKSHTGPGTYTPGTGVWAAGFTNKTATLELTLTSVDAGEFEQILTVDNKTLIFNTTVISASVTAPHYTDYQLPESVLMYLEHGNTYTLSAYAFLNDTVLTQVYPGQNNHKFAIINGDEYLSNRPTALNTIKRVKSTFVYDAGENIVLRIYGQYPEISPTTAIYELGGFALFYGETIDYAAPAILFDEPGLLLDNADYATAVLEDNKTDSLIYFDEINWAGWENDNELIVKGLKITGDINVNDNISVICSIKTLNITKTKSIIINPEDTGFEIGGPTDKWNFNNISLEDLIFGLSIINITAAGVEVQLKNIEITIYYQYDKTRGNPGIAAKGVHSRDLNVFIAPGWDKPEGLETDITSVKLERTDGEFITSSTVQGKEFKIKFNIVADTLQEANDLMILVTDWLSNDRDIWQKPVPYSLVFDWDLNREYFVILKGSIENDFDNGKFECTAKFLLPDGVGYKPVKTTAAIDTNEGLTKVKPVIQIMATGDEYITVREKISGQYLIINHTFENGEVLVIDTDKRTIMDLSGNNYFDKVSPDSFYFRIREDYDFSESEGCIIQTISYREAV